MITGGFYYNNNNEIIINIINNNKFVEFVINTNKSIEYLNPIIKCISVNKTIKSLFIDFDNNTSNDIVDALILLLEENLIIDTLNINFSSGVEKLEKLLEYLKTNNRIKNICVLDYDFNGNNIFDPTIKLLFENSNLELLKIITHINYDTMKYIANILSNNRTLKKLFLGNNRIDNRSAIKLAKALSQNETLEVLDLSKNSISDLGFVELSKVLSVNKTLKKINLLHNRTELGLDYIIDSLSINNTLETMKVTMFYSDHKSIKKLCNYIQTNDTLKKLDMNNLPFFLDYYDETYKIDQLIEAFNKNDTMIFNCTVDYKFIPQIERKNIQNKIIRYNNRFKHTKLA